MVAKEAHAPSSIKGLIVVAAGIDDLQWEGHRRTLFLQGLVFFSWSVSFVVALQGPF